MYIPHRPIALARVQERILERLLIGPAHLTLYLLLILLCMPVWQANATLAIIYGLGFYITLANSYIHHVIWPSSKELLQLLLIYLWRVLSLHFELDSAELDDVAFGQVVVLVMCVWLCVTDHDEHWLVVFWIFWLVDIWAQSIVSYEVVPRSCRAGARATLQREQRSWAWPKNVISWDELNLITDEHNFTSCVSFDILLGYVFAFIIKKAMRITSPGHATHVDLKIGLLWNGLRSIWVLDQVLNLSMLHLLKRY